MRAALSNVDVEVVRPTSLRDFFSVIDGAKLCISTNLHPLILATMMHVPIVGVATHAKTIDFMNAYGQSYRAIPLHRLERGGSVLSDIISGALDLSEEKLSLFQAYAAKANKDAFRPFREIAEALN